MKGTDLEEDVEHISLLGRKPDELAISLIAQVVYVLYFPTHIA